MKTTRTHQLTAVAVSVFAAVASALHSSSDFKDVMADSTHMVSSIFPTLVQDKNYAILLSDCSRTHDTIFKVLRLSWGVGVFEVGVDDLSFNVTQAQLSQVVGEVRKMRRLSWRVTVVVVSDNPAFLNGFAKLSLKGRLLAWWTRLLVVTRLPREKLGILLASHWIFSMMNTMALNINPSSESEGYSLLVHLPYSPESVKMMEVASWTPGRGLRFHTSLTLFPEKYFNFHGATVDVAALAYEPYWNETMKGNTTIYSGICYNLFVIVCQALNFTFRNLPAQSWAEVEDMVEARQTLLTPVVYPVLPNMLKRFDFTMFFEHTGLFFIMASPDITPNWLSFYYPLNGQVWIVVLASMVVVCFLLVQITGSKMWRSRHGRLSSGSVVLEAVGSVLGQGLYGRLSTSHSNHTLVGTWLLFGMVIGTAYRSSLIASLTLPRLPPRPETIEELVRSVDNITIESWGKKWKETFSASKLPAYRAVGELIYLDIEITDGLHDAIRTKKQAHIGGEVNLLLTAYKHFSRLDGTSPLYLGKAMMYKALYGWAIPHDAPYKGDLNRILTHVLQAGLYDQWKKDEMAAAAREHRIKQREKMKNLQKEGKTEKDSQSTELRRLTLTHILGPLLLLLLGLSLGGMVFIMEKFLMTKPPYL